ncbi:MAG: hypothetical protein NT066_00270 [Candidatus Omnitrophica bacterium]|nr:hypothetical protein [Candidatus Omnitrophota bacterium]
MFRWTSQRENILRGARVSWQKKLEGIRLMNELSDKILTKRQKMIRRRLRKISYG